MIKMNAVIQKMSVGFFLLLSIALCGQCDSSNILFTTQISAVSLVNEPIGSRRGVVSLAANFPSATLKRVVILYTDMTKADLNRIAGDMSKLNMEVQFLQEESSEMRNTFLASLLEFTRYDDVRTHVVHFSPYLYFIDSVLLPAISTIPPEDADVVFCNPWMQTGDMSFKNLLTKYNLNLASMGFSRRVVDIITKSHSGSSPLLCGTDVIVFPKSQLNAVVRRARVVLSQFQLESLMPSRENATAAYPYLADMTALSAIMLNLVLLEENIRNLPIVSLQPEVGKLLGQGHSAALIAHAVPFSPYGIHFSPDGNQGCTLHLSDDKPDYIIDAIRISLNHDGNIPCALLSGQVTIIPDGSFVEIGGTDVLLRALPGHIGSSVVLAAGRTADPAYFAALESRLHPLQELVEAVDIVHLTISNVWVYMAGKVNRIKYVALRGCVDGYGTFHKPLLACVPDPTTEWDVGASLHDVLTHTPVLKLPCVISVNPHLRNANQIESFEQNVHRIGYVVINAWDDAVGHGEVVGAISPHCSVDMFDSIRDIVEDVALLDAMPTRLSTHNVASVLHSGPLPKNVVNNERSNKQSNDKAESEEYDMSSINDDEDKDVSRTFPIPAGIALIRNKHKGDPIVIVENMLPIRVLDILEGRLRHRSVVAQGANSHFIEFTRSGPHRKRPRSLVEMVILNYIVPLAVGSQDEALDAGFVGCEWWIQYRESSDPKEYHMDTAITWCRDNGWAEEYLPMCHFYPTIGSVNYITDSGGPTAVFDQTASKRGLKPILPEAIGVAFPKRNRMLLFKGNRFHGVLRNTSYQSTGDTQRLTLLVNYWQNKTAGETFTHVLEHEDMYMKRGRKVMNEEHAKHMKVLAAAHDLSTDIGNKGRTHDLLKGINLPVVVTPTYISMPTRDFVHDIAPWQAQTLPASYVHELTRLNDSHFSSSMQSTVDDVTVGFGSSENRVDGVEDVRRVSNPSLCLMTALPDGQASRCRPKRLLGEGMGAETNEQCYDMCSVSPPLNEAFSGAYVFHLNRSDTANFINNNYKDTVVHHWSKWNINPDTPDGVQILLASRVADAVQWHESMPGGVDYTDDDD